MKYLAVIHSDKEGMSGYFVDLPMTLFAGDTLEELVEDAIGALSATEDVLIDHGKSLPEPTSLEDYELEEGTTIVIPWES